MPDRRFKAYEQNQLRLLPLDLSEMIAEDDLARVIDSVVESLDISALKSFYPGGGAPAYDPRMMLKVVVYAYSIGTYSSRKISAATKTDIRFMWLTGCVPLDHMTINRFRTERLRGCFEDVFAESVLMLKEMGLVSLNDYFLDGTKLEANANRYSFTWKRAVETRRGKLRLDVSRLLDDVDALNDGEDALFSDMPEPGEITADDIAEAAARINARLREKAEAGARDKDLEKARKKIEGDYLARMRRYERDLEDIGEGRKSLSKTDRDATFMRMKEDHMRNGQLKAGYNIQNGTENQFVIHSTVHQRPGDTACMIEHLASLEDAFGSIPGNIGADAGYGSERNYEWLEEHGVRAYVKYPWFHKEQKRSFKKDPTQTANWDYDPKTDEWTCAEGRKLACVGTRTRKTDLGYAAELHAYECECCGACPHFDRCARPGMPKRRFEASPKLIGYKKQAADRLTSPEGIVMRRRRATDVETVFGDVKRNWSFRRFTLRGLGKVAHEWRLVMFGHNMRKLAREMKDNLIKSAAQTVFAKKAMAL